jgi:putative Ca2+/H+ antiporter (TMEM165/GDT1 family)
MTSGNSHIQDEMREVEEELEEDSSLHDTQNARGSTIPLEALEEGKSNIHGRRDSSSTSIPSSPARRSTSPRPRSGPSINFPLSNAMAGGGSGGKKKVKGGFERVKEGVRGTLQVLVNPVFAQAFVLTFLGEWGDRSQITTIAMGAAHVGRTEEVVWK